MSEKLELARQSMQEGACERAEQLCLEVLEQSGDAQNVGDASLVLASLAHQRGDSEATEALLKKGLELAPTHSGLHIQLASLLRSTGRPEEAIPLLRAFVAHSPRHSGVLVSLGLLHQAALHPAEAVKCFRTALAGDTHLTAAWSNMGHSLQTMGRLEEAERCFRQALKLEPERAELWNNLGYNLQLQVRIEEAVDSYQRALAIHPDFRQAHSNLIFGLLYQPSTSPKLLLATCQDWARRHAPVTEGFVEFPNVPDPERPLVIGYLSPNFKQHSDANFLEPLLAGHDHGRVEVVCYSDVVKSDELTERIRGFSDRWHDVRGLNTEQLAALIRHDRVDILVDVTGHMAGNRLPVMGLRPAPIQVSYHGSGTTGLSCIDYRLTDRVIDPPETARDHHSEELFYLDRCFACYATPRGMPDTIAPPALKNGYITFGSFNNLSKTGEGVVTLWSEVLRSVPGSKLMLKAAALSDQVVRERYLTAFHAHAISSDRIILKESSPSIPEHLALYNELDIALDPFPYSGSLTTWEALWMGLPVVTLAGNHFISRQSTSLLTHLGMQVLVTDTPQHYLDMAVALASDVQRLEDLRSGMRRLLADSTTADNLHMASSVEEAFRKMWHRWCAQQEKQRF